MAAMNIVQQHIGLNRAYTGTNPRPNVMTNLVIRMGLGLFMAILPLLFFLFIANWISALQAGTLNREWQVLWAGHVSLAFVSTMFSSVRIAVIIRLVSMKQQWLKKYGRLVGRICTIGATGLSVIIPYTIFVTVEGTVLVPAFMLACFAPVMTFIVVRAASKDYLLRVRIWFDQSK